ncbi:MAG: transaldolase [Hyphomicrobium sp.]|uniref:transaldolase n=1 Tax=Hyphomicrobium sp. TaxID=82 RepID=UPI00132C1475|nr:transaldolase [Hyphomicrobium sp.]KAB2943474.1 MAG: transaldolase [Hyphomicrobium sp.]MBZ0210717.1 transaldolase [Hyphomicrobium sp.]MCZ7594988.1 transaldolase [Hyphomicrobium sp.]
MRATQQLHDAGQSLWIDDITRDMLDSGRLQKMIAELSVTGLTSNPTIFEKAIGKGSEYDAAVEALMRKGLSDEALFFELALDDLRRAADLFLPVHKRTSGVDGFVSLEVSPLLAYDTEATIAEAKRLYAKAGRPNLFIKIPGTREGLPAIEAATFAGVSVNVTLLFSSADYLAAAEAYMRGLERRVAAGLDADVRSVASVFISRWDRAVVEEVPDELKNRLGIAVGQHAYRAYRGLTASDRWQRLEGIGARPQRLLFASTSSKDKRATDTLYIEALAAPNTVNTMPEDTLRAFADHGAIKGVLNPDGGDCDAVLAAYAKAGIDVAALARKLQSDGAKAFIASWQDLLKSIGAKSKALA